jgi:hypothetical protein
VTALRFRAASRRRADGQSVVEFALIVPVLVILLLGGLDFGRWMQARVTAESAARAGASWGASTWANATQPAAPVFNLGNGNCGGGYTYGPSCNILARACAEAAGAPNYASGPPFTGSTGANYASCVAGLSANVCSPGVSQSNPFLSLTWTRADGTQFTPDGTTTQARIGDVIKVDATFCFKTLSSFPLIPTNLKWTATSTYVIQP